jgi:hypothetical protein
MALHVRDVSFVRFRVLSRFEQFLALLGTTAGRVRQEIVEGDGAKLES